jgi:hypothetical protein
MIFQHVNFTFFTNFHFTILGDYLMTLKHCLDFFSFVFSAPFICLKKTCFQQGGDLLRWKVPAARGDLLQWKKVPGGSGKKVPISVSFMLNQQQPCMPLISSSG